MTKFIDISLLNSCNFHCNYCISKSLHAEEAPSGRYEIKGAAIDPDPLISYIKTHFNGAIVQLSGGEPLTYLALSYVVKELIDSNTVIINTNGALIKNVPVLYNYPIYWRVSAHPEQREINILYEDIKPLLDNGCNILINYVLHPRHTRNSASYALDIIDYMEKMKVPFEVTGFEGNYLGVDYRHFNQCYDGLVTELPKIVPVEFVSIQADGRVYGCHSYGNGHNSIGNIYTNAFNPNDTCTHNCIGPGLVSWCSSITSIIRLGLANETSSHK